VVTLRGGFISAKFFSGFRRKHLLPTCIETTATGLEVFAVAKKTLVARCIFVMCTFGK